MHHFADPFVVFTRWFGYASAVESFPSNHCFLATATVAGVPSVRTLLLQSFDAHGFVFYTNSLSLKGTQMTFNPYVSLLFYWKGLKRQVRIEGIVSPVAPAVSDAYFSSRPYYSQLGALASLQSSRLSSMAFLWQRMADWAKEFPAPVVPRPKHWHGFCIVPYRFEFWRDSPFRLHCRHVYVKSADSWHRERLFP